MQTLVSFSKYCGKKDLNIEDGNIMQSNCNAFTKKEIINNGLEIRRPEP